MNRLRDHEERFSAQAIDPIVRRAAQEQLLPRHIQAGQRAQAAVVDAHVAIHVEQSDALFFGIGRRGSCHPFLGQTALPLRGAPLLLTE